MEDSNSGVHPGPRAGSISNATQSNATQTHTELSGSKKSDESIEPQPTQSDPTQQSDRPQSSTAQSSTAQQPQLSDQQLIDYIYDIALDPGNLPEFIDRIADTGLEASEKHVASDNYSGQNYSPGNSSLQNHSPQNKSRSPLELARIQTLSAILESHLNRAETFLDRVSPDQAVDETRKVLASYDSTPALLINAALEIEEFNQMAVDAYGIDEEASLESLPFIDSDIDTLFTTLRQMLRDRTGKGELLALQLEESEKTESTPLPALMHAHWLDIASAEPLVIGGRSGFVLLVSTDISWPLALDQTLHEVFTLTATERGIVRSLVEGNTLNTIAENRNRSIGTIRTQVKSILAKTRTHSQSELIRVTLSLMEIIKRSPLLGTTTAVVKANSPDSNNPVEFWPAEYQTLVLQDGRKLDYLVQGDSEGHPVLFSHMGYGLAHWPPAALRLAMIHKLKVITPVRSGFGKSDKVDKSADILRVTREDTLAVLDHLDIKQISYIAQGNDLIFALDFAQHYRDRTQQIIGLGSRLPLTTDIQYSGMGKWHRFILSTARYAPHLLYFSAKAAFILGRKIGREQMFKNVHQSSPADIAIQEKPEIKQTLLESSQLSLSEDHTAAFAYAKELFATESDWTELVQQTKDIPAWYVSGDEDPLGDPATIAAYREAYPWINIEVVDNAGQLLFYQKFEELIPRIAESISNCQDYDDAHGDTTAAVT